MSLREFYKTQIEREDVFSNVVLDLAYHIHTQIDDSWVVSQEAQQEALDFVEAHGINPAIDRILGLAPLNAE